MAGNAIRFAKSVALAGAFVVLGAGAAGAYQIAHYSGLYVYDDDHGNLLVGEIDRTTTANNTVEKIDNDAYGDRMKITAPFRDRQPGNGVGVHTSVNWAKNGSFCYVSGIGVSADGGSASISCGNGWNDYGHTESKNIQDSSWWFSYHSRVYDPYSNSIRGGLHICQEESDADPCSGKRYMGISY